MIEKTDFDVVIVGAGFAGIYQAWRLCELGFSVRVFEMEAEAGGVWAGNRYPGARVDVAVPTYEFSMEQVWRGWYWKEKFPSREDLTAYFRHAISQLNVGDLIEFNAKVTEAHFDEQSNRWVVTVNETETYQARFLVFCTGPASAPYIPDYKNIDQFQGECHHTGMWPEGLTLDYKRVAVIGTGASGIQLVQVAGHCASRLTVFQRTPINGIPMRQEPLSRKTQDEWKKNYPELFKLRNRTPGGSLIKSTGKMTTEVSQEEMLAEFEKSWEHGGFDFWATFPDVFYDLEANRKIYNFWRDKVRQQLKTEELKELLAPMEPLAPFGAKRPSLVTDYYHIFNQDNVELVSLRDKSIEMFTSKGIRTSDGRDFEFDIIIFATGFDALTGPLTRIDIRGRNGRCLTEHWADGARTQMGIATHGFPNMWFLYGPQSPNNRLIGPTSAEIQGEWLVRCLEHLRNNQIVTMEATTEGENSWDREMEKIVSYDLMSTVSSWQTGGNIPGKKRKLLVYVDTVGYMQHLNNCADSGYSNFMLTA